MRKQPSEQQTLIPFLLFSVPGRAPYGVRVTSFEFTSDLLVEWNPLPQQYANGKLLGYIVYYRENDDESSYKSVFTLVHSPTYITLKGLKPAHQYQVAVTAFTSKGEGPWSDFSYVTTGMFLNDCLCILFLTLIYSIYITHLGAGLAELCLLGNKTQPLKWDIC